MSDDCGYDPGWWKAAKAVSVERKSRATRAGATAKPGDTFLIVTEGTVTEPQKFDHVWAVVDTDVAVRNGYWNDVKQLAAARKVRLAHSTSCFEYWLLLHLRQTTRRDLVNGDKAKHAVKEELGATIFEP